ncbi:MAG TPA: ABC transporter ATP-binding protein [Rhizobiales bacterium]|nr:ABC transporter ATP-binding protein [Hyphomicrobiales bacterium]
MAETISNISLAGIVKRYGDVTALDGVSLVLDKNEYVSLLGPSGSGKTSLLRVIAGFERPDAGTVTVFGRDVTNLAPHKRGIGFVFQNFALFPHLSVYQNVAFGLVNADTPPPADEVRRRVTEMIRLVGLTGLEGRDIGQISGGQRQRVALARTLVTEPRLILLDEPLGALDANLRMRMRDELRNIRERLGVTFLHVTGSETEALAMGDRVVVLDRGAIAQFATPDTIMNSPANPNVARFLNRYNVLLGELRGDAFVTAYGDLAYGKRIESSDGAYGIRYDRIAVVGETAPSAGVEVPVTFVASEYLGSAVMYFFEAADGHILEVEHHLGKGRMPEYRSREKYKLQWKPEDAIVFG